MTDKKPVEVSSDYKTWWSGDPRVEPYMVRIAGALDRRGINGEARTDVYNRCYEAVYEAILKYDTTPPARSYYDKDED